MTFGLLPILCMDPLRPCLPIATDSLMRMR